MTPYEKDRTVLRRLAERQAEMAALPVHKHTMEGWRRVNNLERGKPMVWINEICWSEFRDEPELRLECSDPFLRGVELTLRRTLYQWAHLPVDMIVEPVFYCPLAIHDTGFGIRPNARTARIDPTSDVLSWDYQPQIQSEKDVERICVPEVTHDETESQRRFELLNNVFGDLLRIEKRGIAGYWFAPWDLLVQWWGVEEALTDLVMRPELVHLAMERLVNAYIARLDQWEQLNLLSLNNNNLRIGSGGLGYCDELPADGFDPSHVRAKDLWGCATAQIFVAVSPAMHEEFALQYERRWLERFGLTYYGCCEPLHRKVDILKSIPNLRKISMSPFIDLDVAAEAIGDRYVFSRKPSPAIFAADVWNPDQARAELRETLEKTRGCVVEVIMKDISTVRYEPRRLWEWAQIAADMTAEYA